MTPYAHIAANVRRLRQAARLTQSALAEASGRSAPCIKKIESGKHLPETSTLMAIAKALGVSVFDLVRKPESLDAVRFRDRKTVLRECERFVILNNVARWFEEYAFLEEVTGTVSHLDRTPFKGVLKSPEKLAVRFREVFGIGRNAPIYDPCALLEQAGIKVFFYQVQAAGFSGLSVSDEKRGDAVIVNDSGDISTEHKIFTAFYEVGHLLMHLTGYKSDECREDPHEESQADEFASYLLMPREAFRTIWNETRGNPFLDRVFRTKQYFRVSYRAVLRRLIDEKIAQEDVWVKFAQMYNRATGENLQGHREPFAMEPEHMNRYGFWDDRFARLVFDAGVKEKITLSKGADLLKIPVTEFRDQVFGVRRGREGALLFPQVWKQ